MGSFFGYVKTVRSFAVAEIHMPAEGITITPLTEPELIKLADGNVLFQFTGPIRVEGVTVLRGAELVDNV